MANHGSFECTCENNLLTYKQPAGELFTSWVCRGPYQYNSIRTYKSDGNKLREKMQNNSLDQMKNNRLWFVEQNCTYANQGPLGYCNNKADCDQLGDNSICQLERPYPSTPYNYDNIDFGELVEGTHLYSSDNIRGFYQSNTGLLYSGGMCKIPTYPEMSLQNNIPKNIGFDNNNNPIECNSHNDCDINAPYCNKLYNSFGSGLQTGYCTTLLPYPQDISKYKDFTPFMRPSGAGIPMFSPITKCETDADCYSNRHCTNINLNDKFCLMDSPENYYNTRIDLTNLYSREGRAWKLRGL